MGMDLLGAGGTTSFNGESWRNVLLLAEQCGWKPMGTKAPDYWETVDSVSGAYKEWSGTYFSNDYQLVDAADALNIAHALERALPDIPDHDAMEDKTHEIAPGIRVVNDGIEVTPCEWFSGTGKQMVKDFISFCRAGEFCIG